MKRIVIVGCGGAGKSTLARQLGPLLRLPVVHLDAVFWQPGWQAISREQEHALLEEIAVREAWIIDGNYQATMPLRLEAADTIIFLDFSTWRCLYRVLKRYVQYRGRTRPDMGEGCPEKLDGEFLHWILRYRISARPRVLASLARYGSGREVFVFRNPRQVSAFLQRLTENISSL
jgi:adenylate kinase family enzyme